MSIPGFPPSRARLRWDAMSVRNDDIARRYRKGETLEQIGARYDLSISRVSRILGRMAARATPEQHGRRAAERDKSRAFRDRAIVQEYHAGQTLEQVAVRFGMTASGISRVLSRMDASLTPQQRASRPRAGGSGRKAVWPDCPPEMKAEYMRIRLIIGSQAARDQLLRLAARAAGSTSHPSPFQPQGSAQ